MNVEHMVNDILRREGGYVNHPSDRGGATNFGITIKTLSGILWLRQQLRKTYKICLDDVAREIYLRNYYYAPGINRLPGAIQPFIFDCAVNHGPRRAIKFLQSVCNQAGYQPRLSEDGAIGPNSLAGINWAQQEMGSVFLQALVEERRNFYYTIVEARPSQEVVFKWLA